MGSIEEKNLKIDENLNSLNKNMTETLEKRCAHMADKARLVIGVEGDGRRSAYESLFSKNSKSYGAISENEKYVKSVFKAVNTYDRINCVDSFRPTDDEVLFTTDLSDVFTSDTVVYLKNPLTDIAYNNFSKLLRDARVSYEDTFAEVCEEVYYSRAPYCILPIENTEDGRLSGFGNMIRKYGLKIVLTCNVESATGRITKFALLQRELSIRECPSGVSDGEYLEIGFNFGDDEKLTEVIASAKYFGFKLHKVDSLPIYYSEKEYYFDVVFKGKGELKKFLFWLELEVPGYEVIGVYTHIKANKVKNGG